MLQEQFQIKSCLKYVYYVDGTKTATWLIWLIKPLKWIMGIEVEKMQFRLIDVRDESGLLLRLRVPYQDIFVVQNESTKSKEFNEFVKKNAFYDRLPSYLWKCIATTPLNISSDRATMWRALLLIQICLWKMRQEGDDGRNAVLFLERRPWHDHIRSYASRYGIDLVAHSPAFVFRLFARRFLSPKGVAYLRAFRAGLYDLFLVFKNRIKPSLSAKAHKRTEVNGQEVLRYADIEKNCFRIGIQYQGQLNLKNPDLYSDLFFWQQSGLKGSDLVLFFSSDRDPLDRDKWLSLQEFKIGAVALYPGASKMSDVLQFIHYPKLRSKGNYFEKKLALTQNIERKWLQYQKDIYEEMREYWRALFLKQSIKGYLTWDRFDARHYAIADSLQDVGGFMAVYQRACQLDPSPEIAVNADLMFGYSPLDALVEKKSGSQISYHIAVGYFGDHRFGSLKVKAQKTRDLLEANGAKFLLAFFDENSVDDSRWHTGHEFMRENYQFLLEKVLEDNSIGLLLKPKYPSTLRIRLGPVAELLQRALSTGRCHIFEKGSLHGSHPPVEAALASDLAIHGHLCAATAGLESALAGVPTLLMDREGWAINPFYKLGLGRVVFTDWLDAWEALTDFRNNPNLNDGFGDWSSMLDELDPFRDGRGAERMGNYLKWIVDGFDAGLSAEESLADAAERYMKEWGIDKITKVSGSMIGVDFAGNVENEHLVY